MLQINDYDFRNQRKILVLEMLEILGAQTLTKILLHCVMPMRGRSNTVGKKKSLCIVFASLPFNDKRTPGQFKGIDL